MDDKQIALLGKLIETGSMRQAAADLFMSRSAAAYQVKALEQELGFDLVKSDGKKIELTEAGYMLYQRMAQLQIAIDQAKQDSLNIAKRGMTNLSIATRTDLVYPDTFGALFYPFMKTQPNCMLNVVEMPLVGDFDFLAPLDQNRADIAFGIVEHEGDIPNSYRFELLRDMPIRCMVSIDHPLAAFEKVSPDVLRDYPTCKVSYGPFAPDISRIFRSIESQNPLNIIDDWMGFEITCLLITGRTTYIAPILPSQLDQPGTGPMAVLEIEGVDPVKLGLFWKPEKESEQLLDFVRIAREMSTNW